MKSTSAPPRQYSFSLAWMLALIVIVSICFAIMTYAGSFGIAFAILAALVLVRIAAQKESAWRVGWRCGLLGVLATLILAPSLGWFIYTLMFFFVGWGFIQVTPDAYGNLNYLPLGQRLLSQFTALATALLVAETVISLALRKKPAPARSPNDDAPTLIQ